LIRLTGQLRIMIARSHQHGFSLIELLVAIVVFSVGLLAVAGLQTVSKRANFEGLQRTVASQIANGLLEDIRTNGNGMDVYLGSADLGGGLAGGEPVPSCRTVGAECNAAQKAAHDLWFWEDVLDGNQEIGIEGAAGGILLPTICITGPAGGGPGIYVVSVAWQGTVAMTGTNQNQCGAGTGKYGSGDELRRIVQVPTFIDPSI
jgi:type IV pilus assembly protein PilV